MRARVRKQWLLAVDTRELLVKSVAEARKEDVLVLHALHAGLKPRAPLAALDRRVIHIGRGVRYVFAGRQVRDLQRSAANEWNRWAQASAELHTRERGCVHAPLRTGSIEPCAECVRSWGWNGHEWSACALATTKQLHVVAKADSTEHECT